MNKLKVPTTKNYHEYLISSLQDPISAAGYLEVILEIEDNQPEPELLQAAFKDIVDAYLQNNQLTQEAHELYKKLDQMLSQSKGEEIYTFISWLNAMGFQLNVTVKPVDQKE
ncbi:conserved hypothetical protein [Planktothrix serta PCC 8927]|uniref:Uncharacterized protein n=1 Tax=Planktothrix serta PCC 8927 TaxID=671068 RepID=A0A7Z9BZY9_9CYAN|nr:hypothetical protein [Planktothrix serta]VXD25923.1 conserved hypothetical protein [Planktothrix serta PCC 8927]